MGPLSGPLVLAALVAALALWLPGALLRRGFGIARGPWGAGTPAVDASLSLGFLSLVLLPLYVLRAPVVLAPAAVAAATAALLAWAMRTSDGRERLFGAGQRSGTGGLELAAFAAAVLLVVPATLAYSGANVDDWWDLSFVRGWMTDGHFGFAQMALSPDPATGASAVHPRFLWSVWLVLQTVLASVTGAEAWRVQAGPLAGITSVLVVSAQVALAHALARGRRGERGLAAATALAAAAWMWGTDALPLFVRGYQDKLFAGFVIAPVLIAVMLDAASGAASQEDALREGEGGPPGRTRAALAVGAVATAAVSVHSLVFTMAVFLSVLAVAARCGRRTTAWLRTHRAVACALVIPALYPVLQSLVLATTFSEQGVSLVSRDNPVVRAHLSLNRLFGDVGPAWIVRPSAVFGPVAVLAIVGLFFAWRRRRDDDAARVLLAITLAPCVLLFVPGIAALAGMLWVPWMLYRLGWLVPVAPLLAYATMSLRAGHHGRFASAVFAVLVAIVATATARDRLRRDMDEHPAPPPGAPMAAARAAFEFLAARDGRGSVLAPPNFSELVPAMTGKSVVAFSERGTLVFSSDETRAYERLRDRARFFSADTSAGERDALARTYGVRWAVLPRRLVASGSEAAWMRRFGPEALLAARRCDDEVASDAGVRPAGSACGGWWSASRDGALGGLTDAWTIAFETRDYFVAARVPAAAAERVRAEEARDDHASRAWLRPFALPDADAARSALPEGATVLARATGAPGATVRYDIPPRFVLPSVMPVWLEGPAPWEDVPAEVSISLDFGVACSLSAVEVVPHLPHDRRDVFEIAVGDRVSGSGTDCKSANTYSGSDPEYGACPRFDNKVRAAARHGVAIAVPLANGVPRRRVTVRVRSLIGNPVSLADVRVLGMRASCGEQWPVVRSAKSPQMVPTGPALLDLAATFPSSGRPLVSLARRANSSRGEKRRIELLEEASRREPSLVEAWLDLGFAYDRLAESAGDGAARAREAARRAFFSAVRADSHSAWAQGSAAWADQRSGHTLAALVRAVAAANIDPLYGDAWTIAAYALGDLRLYALADHALALAKQDDPDRNWPTLARADLALARYAKSPSAGKATVEAAEHAMTSWLDAHPFDAAVQDKLSELVRATEAAGPPAESTDRSTGGSTAPPGAPDVSR